MAMAMDMAMAIATISLEQKRETAYQLCLRSISEPWLWRNCKNSKKYVPFSDFKRQSVNKNGCIHGRFHIPGVHTRLAAVIYQQEHGQYGLSKNVNCGKAVYVEQLWLEFFSDPSQWWDNRYIKRSPKYPDFSHKRTNDALWIKDELKPAWVDVKLATLEPSHMQSNDELRSWLASFFNDADEPKNLSQEGELEESLQIVEHITKQNIRAPIDAFAGILKECARRKALVEGKRTHALIVLSRLDSDIFLGKTLIDMYAKCGSLSDARKVFNTMPKHNVYSWTAIISAYADYNQGQEAVSLFRKMQHSGIAPDRVAFVVILKFCAKIEALELGKQLHSEVSKSGLGSDVVIGNILVDMYAKCGCIERAQQAFDQMTQRNVISWNTMIAGYIRCGLLEHAHYLFSEMKERNVASWNSMITGYVHNGCAQDALALYERMRQDGVLPNQVTCLVLLKACASIGALEQGEELHIQIIKSGFESDPMVSSALVDMYAKCGSLEQARRVFNNIPEPSVASWTAMIAGCSQNGHVNDALALYKQMREEDVQPNKVTYVTLLKACASIAALEQGKHLHSQIKNSGLELDMMVDSALIDMYAKCGCIEQAHQVFNQMSRRDVISWTAMIAGYGHLGRGKEALTLLEQMQRQGVMPDKVTYVSVLSACCRSGLLDEAFHIFRSMSEDHAVTPTMEHYTCMVDLLGRVGRLGEAEEFINKMPLKADAVVWITLLGAARNHGNLQIGRRAFDHVVKLEPDNASAYVLYSNVCSAAGRMDEVAKLRRSMKDAGIKRMAGYSWIEVANEVYAFLAGDARHPKSKEIRTEWHRLLGMMKKAGYIPDLSIVFHDVEDEEKENVLCEHSLKLAIIFGLISTSPGTCIRVKKNIPICSDCHNASKIISKIVQREIIVMDAKLCHHIKDGVCSCHDYW